jgi:choline dehydrogenase-like flavoprotein
VLDRPDDQVTLWDMKHPMGTTRMASCPSKGVVNADCRVHGVENLYVAGSSIFPTGGHANPTLLIVALAARLASHLRRVAGQQRNVNKPVHAVA